MTARHHGYQTIVELCENCGRNTVHQISIEIRTESTKKENAEFSREPYRIATCQQCGRTTSQRMNNA
ncbi:hypothetical protein [Haladaptatus sp. CMAA 1911]|uniref:DUF7835 family putative zinc beta-ribbon protein n=1 Tax=unclassified Haladaptatus TaxID=2622732 RepID=UPI0037549D65